MVLRNKHVFKFAYHLIKRLLHLSAAHVSLFTAINLPVALFIIIIKFTILQILSTMKKLFTALLILLITKAFSQNVGIGISTPLAKLHVNIADSGVAIFQNTQTLANTSSASKPAPKNIQFDITLDINLAVHHFMKKNY